MDDKEKNVQIPYKTFISLLLLTSELLADEPNIDFEEVEKIYNTLNKKLDAMEKRNLYTKYKTGSTEAERKEARKKYIEKINLHKDFKY